MCRNWPGDARHSEYVLGTSGHAHLGRLVRTGDEKWGGIYEYAKANPGEEPSPYTLEHRDMIASIRSGSPLNEMQQLAESSLAMIMMREAAYSGREVTRDFLLKESKRVLGPEVPPDQLEFGPREVEPVAVPGKYELG